MKKQALGLIVGPTACGKTALSIRLAKDLQAEIISADSIQVYKGLDIGSAKPSMEERQGIAHHLLDALPVDSPKFSVAAFQQMAGDCIRDIAQRGKFPLVVGGTGLYVNSLIYPLDFSSAPGDPRRRAELEKMEENEPGFLHEYLKKIDPDSALRLHKNDRKRLIRAIEVYENTGKPIGGGGYDFSNEKEREIPYEPRIVGINMPRELLYARIEKRVDKMMEEGLLEETEALVKAGYDPALPALQGLGYKQLIAYFRGEYSLEEAVERIKQETRHFAKRQITWFKRDTRIRWFDVSALSEEELYSRVKAVLAGEE